MPVTTAAPGILFLLFYMVCYWHLFRLEHANRATRVWGECQWWLHVLLFYSLNLGSVSLGCHRMLCVAGFYIFLRYFHLSEFGSCNWYLLVDVANFSFQRWLWYTRLQVTTILCWCSSNISILISISAYGIQLVSIHSPAWIFLPVGLCSAIRYSSGFAGLEEERRWRIFAVRLYPLLGRYGVLSPWSYSSFS